MKRFEASSTLSVENSLMGKCDNSNIDKRFNQRCKIQNDHDNNRTVTFSDQDSDESIFKVPLQSTSSGYYSLDETENDSSKRSELAVANHDSNELNALLPQSRKRRSIVSQKIFKML